MALVGLAMFGIFFYNSLFLQNVLGYSAIKTGATFLPMTVLIILVAPVAGRLTDRIGPRWLMAAGMTLLTVSLLLFGTLDARSSFWNDPPGARSSAGSAWRSRWRRRPRRRWARCPSTRPASARP